MPITSNIQSSDKRAAVKTKIAEQLDYYYGSGNYTLDSWADARSLLNSIHSPAEIYNGSAAPTIVENLNTVNNLPDNPDLDLNFIANTYSVHGSSSTLADSVTHVRNGNATMVDGYGPELVTNGTFDTDTSGWAADSCTLSVIGGELSILSGASGSGAYQVVNTEIGKTYFFSGKYDGSDSRARIEIRADNQFGAGYATLLQTTSEGTFTSAFVAISTDTYIKLEAFDLNKVAKYDNISVREMPVLKWAPHNLLTYSEDLSNWILNNSSVSGQTLIADSGTGIHTAYSSFSNTANIQNTYEAKVEAGTHSLVCISVYTTTNFWISAVFDLSTGSVTQTGTGASSGTIESTLIVDNGDNTWTIKLTGSIGTNTGAARVYIGLAEAATGNVLDSPAGRAIWQSAATGSESIVIHHATAYRSDLGGMVDNPSRNDSYVPTTSSAVYLPRVGHHEYNGYTWVNKGVLAESEARTNLAKYSEPDSRSSSNTVGEWTFSKLNPTTEITNVIGPDGVSDSARECALSSLSYDAYVFRVPVTAGLKYTVSAYVKLGTSTNFAIHVNDTNSWDSISDGYKTFASSDGLNTERFERISLTFTAPSSGSVNVHIGGHSSGLHDQQVAGTVIIYGFQIELGSVPSSLIPTSGSTVTRAADSFTIPAAKLPASNPAYLGPELVTNGTFDTDVSGWYAAVSGTRGDITWDNGAIVVDNSILNYNAAVQAITTEAGKVYKFTADLIAVDGVSSANVLAATNNPAGATPYAIKSNLSLGQNELIFVAQQTTVYIVISAGISTDSTYDNVSVREVNSLSAVSIGMKGEMDYSDEGTLPQHEFVRWYADASNYVRYMFDTQTGTGGPLFRQAASGVIDGVVQYSAYSPGLNVPFDIASRHGSTVINGAVDGIALTANTTPTALPDLSTTDLSLAYDFMGTINRFVMWGNTDLKDGGLEALTEPSTEPTLSLTFDGQSSSFTDTGYLP